MGYFDKLNLDPTLFRPREPEEAPSRGMLGGVADLGIEAVSGVARGVKFTADAFGADNAVSRSAGTVDEFARSYLSAQAQEDDRKAAEIMAAAQDAGIWEQVKAGIEAFAQSPVRTAVNALGTSVPTIAAAMIPGVGQAGAVARLGMLGGMGAVQGAGVVKGSVYQAVKDQQLQAGMTEAEAEAAATRAQEYGGENTGNIIGGTVLGAAAASTGAQPILAKLLTKPAPGMLTTATQEVERGLLKRVGMGVLAEAPMEAAQGGQEQYAQNIALQNEGFDVPTWRGVASQATLEGMASAPMGGVTGALDKPRPTIADIGNAGSVDEAIAATVATVEAPVSSEPLTGMLAPDKPKGPAPRADILSEIRSLDPELQSEAIGLFDTSRQAGASPAVKRWAMNRLDEILLPVRQIPVGQVIEEELLPVPDTQELSAAEAFGQIAQPPARGQMLKPGQRIPRADATEIAPDEIELGQLPVGEAIEVGGERPEGMAERTGLRTGMLIDPAAPNAIAQFIAKQQATGTPASRAFVQDYRAGRITDADVMSLLVPSKREPTADERIAAAAAQAPTIQPTDLVTGDGMPYGSKTAANIRAKKEGLPAASVVEIPNAGWVVRTEKAPDAAIPAGNGVPESPDARRGDGGELLREPRPGNLAEDASTPDGAGVVGVGTAGVGAREGAAPDAALTDIPTLKQRWSEAAKRGDAEAARSLSDRINALKARAAAPTPADPAPTPGGAPDLVASGMFLVVGGKRYPVRSFQEASEMARTAADAAKDKNGGMGVRIGPLPIEDAQGRVIAHRGVSDKIIVGPPVLDGAPQRSKVLYDPIDAIRADIQAKNEARTIDAEPVAKKLPAPAPDLVKVPTVFGQNTYVRREDLDSDKPRMRAFTSTGKSNGTIVRENLDPTGEKRAANAKEDAENPLFNVITRKGGLTFATEAVAARELAARGLGETHEVAPASSVSPGIAGFVVKRKAAAEAPAPDATPDIKARVDAKRKAATQAPAPAAARQNSAELTPTSEKYAPVPDDQARARLTAAGYTVEDKGTRKFWNSAGEQVEQPVVKLTHPGDGKFGLVINDVAMPITADSLARHEQAAKDAAEGKRAANMMELIGGRRAAPATTPAAEATPTAAPSATTDAQPAPKRAGLPSFRKNVKVSTPVYVEESNAFEQRDTDAETALNALDADIDRMQKFLLCLTG